MVKKLAILFILALVFMSGQTKNVAAWGFPSTDWTAVQSEVNNIETGSLLNATRADQIQANMAILQANETNPDVLRWAEQITVLAAHMGADSNATAVTANDMNARIDGSEGTTLGLSDDILSMAGEIGVMANRILLTEAQIGIMADRIVDSEQLINAGSLDLLGNNNVLTLAGMDTTLNMLSGNNFIISELDGNPSMPSADWTSVLSSNGNVQQNSLINAAQAALMREDATSISANESDPNVINWANQIVQLSDQMEFDANSISTLANTINTRANNGGSPLEMSADILLMAGDIGVTADRILTSEESIGKLADRIQAADLDSDNSSVLALSLSMLSNSSTSRTNSTTESNDDTKSEVGQPWGLPSTDWSSLQGNALTIQAQAMFNAAQAAVIRQDATKIQSNESNPAVVGWATQIIALATQMEMDANALAIAADDVNTRIDNSEGTTLGLSADILRMAGEIGVMADRILVTEDNIGIMADRIVGSEYMINSSSLVLAARTSHVTLAAMDMSNNIISNNDTLSGLGNTSN